MGDAANRNEMFGQSDKAMDQKARSPIGSSICSKAPEDETSSKYLIKSATSVAELYTALETALLDFGVSSFLFFKSEASGRRKLDTSTILSNWPTSVLEPIIEREVFKHLGSQHPSEGEHHSFQYNVRQILLALGFKKFQKDNQEVSFANGVGYTFSTPHPTKPIMHALLGGSCIKEMVWEVKLQELTQIAAFKLASLISEGKTPNCSLSKRELECLQWTSEGKTSYEIAIILRLSEHTINNYIASLTKKLGAMNRAHMISLAYKTGLLA